MKTKKLILCAAFGELAYTIYVIARHIISTIYPYRYHFDFVQDICQRSICNILLISIIIVCFALIQSFPKQTTKPFRIFTFWCTLLLSSILAENNIAGCRLRVAAITCKATRRNDYA